MGSAALGVASGCPAGCCQPLPTLYPTVTRGLVPIGPHCRTPRSTLSSIPMPLVVKGPPKERKIFFFLMLFGEDKALHAQCLGCQSLL